MNTKFTPETLAQTIQTIADALDLQDQSAEFQANTKLLRALPELDSLAVAALLGALERKFSIRIEDDDIDGSTLASIGSLAEFIQTKIDSKT